MIIPCFNAGSTLPETLASVRGEPCDLVVVDDGSTDPQTVDVLAAAEADGVRVIRQENQGVAAARMTGVHATTAPYVFPLDADDLLAPGALQDLADSLDRHPDARVAWGWIGFVGSDAVSKTGPRLDPWLLTYMNTLPVLSLVRRDALLAVGGWRSGVLHEDWDLWLSFAERGWDGIRIPRVTAYYRPNRTGRWATSRGRYDEALARFRHDHEALYAARPVNRRRSTAPLRLKWGLPLLDSLPLGEDNKLRVGALLRRPAYTVRQALEARRRFGIRG